jgi:RNA binding exosome subunit
LVDKDNVTFNIGYGNVIEIDDAQIDSYEIMKHISDVLDDFVTEDEEEDLVDEIVDENETGHTLPGFEEGIGLDNLNIRFQDKQGI